MQLQGELQKRGTHVVHYKNILHAAVQIVKHDGVVALQAGLVPALWVQFIMNCSRLGGYQLADSHNLIRDKHGNIRFERSVLAAGLSGVFGHYCSNPMHLVRTHKQSMAAKSIAVGFQHKEQSMVQALREILNLYGIKGLWRGGIAIFPRAFIASSSQLVSFSYTKQWLNEIEYFQKKKILTSFVASFIGGIAISVLTTPFDLVLIRLYNQGLGKDGKGILYNGYFDCVIKVYKQEGALAFFKGIGPMYFRLGPHSVLTLMFWDFFKAGYEKVIQL